MAQIRVEFYEQGDFMGNWYPTFPVAGAVLEIGSEMTASEDQVQAPGSANLLCCVIGGGLASAYVGLGDEGGGDADATAEPRMLVRAGNRIHFPVMAGQKIGCIAATLV